MNSLKVKKGDTVVVLTGKKGKDGIKGKQGKVISVIPSENKVIIDGLRIQKRHTKAKSAKSQAGIVEQSGPIDASNVMVICPKCGKPTRVGHAFDAEGKKIRVCKRTDNGAVCGGSLDKGNKTEKKAAKAEKKTAEKADTQTAEKPVKKAAPKKTAEKKTAAADQADKADA